MGHSQQGTYCCKSHACCVVVHAGAAQAAMGVARGWPQHLEAMSIQATVIPDLLHEENTAYAIPWSACSFS